MRFDKAAAPFHSLPLFQSSAPWRAERGNSAVHVGVLFVGFAELYSATLFEIT